MLHVVSFEPRHRKHVRAQRLRDRRQQRRATRLVAIPDDRGRHVHGRIGIEQPSQVGAQQVATLGGWNVVDERLPVFRIDQPDRAEPPVEIDLAAQPDAAQDQRTTCLRMSGRVRQRERRAPRAAEHDPAIDVQMAAQGFDVAHQMLRRVLVHARCRRRTPGAALIEQHDPIDRGIEEPPMRRIAAGARSSMQEHRRATGRVAAQLVDEPMSAGNFEHAAFRTARSTDTDRQKVSVMRGAPAKSVTSRSRSAAVLCRCGDTRMLLPRAPTYTSRAASALNRPGGSVPRAVSPIICPTRCAGSTHVSPSAGARADNSRVHSLSCC